MALSVKDFWKLAFEGSLLTPLEGKQLWETFAASHAADARTVEQLVPWLVKQRKLTSYQAKVLLAGRAGPFKYGDYLIRERIEQGRLKGLFRAQHIATGQRVGLYFLAGPTLQEPATVARLQQQTARAAQASGGHPHLARCYHLVDTGDYQFVVLEDLRGQSLAEHLAQKSEFAAGDACRHTLEIALALSALNQHGVPYGELRPENLWLDAAGMMKLLHFPLARDPLLPPVDWRALVTGNNELPAQADYLAPEWVNAGTADIRADIYSLGCVLHEMLCHQPLFPGGDLRQKAARHASETPRPANEIKPEVPLPVVALVNYLVAKSPADRYQQPGDVAAAVAPFVTPAKIQPPGLSASSATILSTFEQWAAEQLPAVASAEVVPAAPAIETQAAVVAAAAPTTAPAVDFTAFAEVASVDASERGLKSLRRSQRAAARSQRIFIGLFAVLLLASAAGGYVFYEKFYRPTTQGDLNGETPIADGTAGAAGTAGVAVVAASGTSALQQPIVAAEEIWQSPTSGHPWDLKYVPPGTPLVMMLRPKEFLQTAEATRLLDPRSTGPLGEWLRGAVQTASGVPLDSMETLQWAVLDQPDLNEGMVWVIRSAEPLDRGQLVAAWGDPEVVSAGKHEYFRKEQRGWYLPSTSDNKLLIVAPAVVLEKMLAADFAPPPLSLEFESLWTSTDQDRMVTVLFRPRFLLDQRGWFSGNGTKVRETLESFLLLPTRNGGIEPPKAALASLHLADGRLFTEFRAYNSFPGQSAVGVARDYLGQLQNLVESARRYRESTYPSPYGYKILTRLPDMLEQWQVMSRAASDGEQGVLRAYLPEEAAHNLALGGYLALTETGAGTAAVAATPMPMAAAAGTVEAALAKPTSMAFANNSFEQVIKALSDDIGVEIVIVGGDLQLDGITRNQQIKDFEESNQPAGEILRKIMLRANPAGKLVYVIKPKEGTQTDILHITTRAAVQKRGDKLPPELAEASTEK